MAVNRWIPAYVGVGSNLNDPAQQVRRAFAALEQIPDTRLVSTSALYQNPPMGPADQPDYVNAVAAVSTTLTASALLSELLAIEQHAGRQRNDALPWGPRIIDLDLLVFGDRIIDDPELTIPHPGISERNFVLFPLLEVAPDLSIPGLGPVSGLAGRIDGSSLRRVR